MPKSIHPPQPKPPLSKKVFHLVLYALALDIARKRMGTERLLADITKERH